MSELHVTFDGHVHAFAPSASVRVGRSADNDVVVSDPTVSRRHAQITWQATGWIWQNAGQAPTFLNGQPVASFQIAQPVEVHLGSPQGPAIRLQPVAAQEGPVRTALAAPGVPAAAAAAAVAAPPAAAPPAGSPGFPGQVAGVGAAGPQPGFAGAGQPGAPGPGQVAAATPPLAGAHPGGPPPGPPGSPWAVPPGAPGFGQPGSPGFGQPGSPGFGQPGSPGFGQPGSPWIAQPGGPIATNAMGGSFFQTLIPIRSWLHDPGWRQGMRLIIIPYALLPLIFVGLFSASGNLTTPGWAYSLYIAPLWLLAFWALIRPPRIGRFEIPVAIGIIIWTLIWLQIVTKPLNGQIVSKPGPLNLAQAVAIGFNEESTKAIPVLIAAILLRLVWGTKLDARTWMLMGTIAGLTFGVVEQALYTPQAIFGIHAAQQAGQAVVQELLFVFRVFVDGFQHAVWAGVSGFFIGIAVNYRRLGVPMVLVGVAIPALLHAFNDWTLSVFSTVWVTVFLVQGLSLLLFLGYTLSASAIERSVRTNPAFRGESMLMERYNLPGNLQ